MLLRETRQYDCFKHLFRMLIYLHSSNHHQLLYSNVPPFSSPASQVRGQHTKTTGRAVKSMGATKKK